VLAWLWNIPGKGDIIVTRKVTLTVNNAPIELDYFVAGYLDHVTGGILASLKGTGEIKTLKLTIDAKGLVKIRLNSADVPINYFVEEIIRSTFQGVIAPLKGVAKDKPLQSLELNIAR
jgi:signal peptidase I